jgi:hypothetical protein
LPISAVDAINPAFQHAKKQLLQPFRFSQWWRLALVGMLAGEMSSGGGLHGNFNLPSTHREGGSQQFLSLGWPKLLGDHALMFAGLIAFLVVAGIILIVLFTYIGSVMRFILFDSIVAKECHIRKGWAKRRREGRQLFVWQIALIALNLLALLILIGIPAAFAWGLGWFAHPREHVLQLVLGGIVLVLEFIALVVAFAVVHVMTKDFVVPQMALENITAFEGWRRLWLWVKAEKSGYAGYIGTKILLAIAASMAVAIIALILIVVLLIPIGGIGAVVFLGAKAAGVTWNLYTITLGVSVACVILAIFLFAISMISVPAIVFFPAYSIYFLAARYPPLAAQIWPPLPGSLAPIEPGLT